MVDIVITYNDREYINEAIAFEYQYGGEKWLKPSFHMEIRLKHNYPKSLYCALLFFDGSDGSITNCLLPGEHLSIIKPVIKMNEGKTIDLEIKEELLQKKNKGKTVQVQDYLKLIICEKEFDSSLMLQDGLSLYQEKAEEEVTRSLDSILETLMWNAHNRSIANEDNDVEIVDWASKSINITISHNGK